MGSAGTGGSGLAERYEVVTWDRRGHSRSQDGDGPGSRAEDAADLAGLIEHLGEPVHVAGNSYGAAVTLTLLIDRPDLVATAAGPRTAPVRPARRDRRSAGSHELSVVDADLSVVRDLIRPGKHRDAAEHFVDNVALGAGRWDQLPASFRAVLEHNAATYLDELADETALSIDTAALAATEVPLLLTTAPRAPGCFLL